MKPRGQKRPRFGEPQRITRAVTHIRLCEANPGKLAALDTLAPIYLALCQEYVQLFCTDRLPGAFHPPICTTPQLSTQH